jgi:DNA-binding XRE family transcriptional regulator
MNNKGETLGQRIQRVRAEAGKTQNDIAAAAEVPLTTYQSWEVDRREPSWRSLVRLARVLGCVVEDFADTIEVQPGQRPIRPAGPTKRMAIAPSLPPVEQPRRRRKRKEK